MDEITKLIISMGPGGVLAAIMFYLFRDERIERRSLQSERNQEIREGIRADMVLADALKELKNTILERRG